MTFAAKLRHYTIELVRSPVTGRRRAAFVVDTMGDARYTVPNSTLSISAPNRRAAMAQYLQAPQSRGFVLPEERCERVLWLHRRGAGIRYGCTLAADHRGLHCAHDEDGTIIASWTYDGPNERGLHSAVTYFYYERNPRVHPQGRFAPTGFDPR